MAQNIVNPFALIGSLSGRGRDFTRARNAYIAREALLGTKQADVVKGSGVDKGDVSRIFKQAADLPKSGKVRKGILSLNPSSVDVERFATIVDAVELGKSFERTNKGASGKGNAPAAGAPSIPAVESGEVRVTRTDDTGKVETVNVPQTEALFEWLTADNGKHFEERWAMVEVVHANAESYLAEQAAA